MACHELVELVTDYLDEVLSARDRARFEAHLAECDDCTAYVEQFTQTIAALHGLPPDEPDRVSVDALLQVFRGWSRERETGAPDGGGAG